MSTVGDQLAKVALALMVFGSTGSATLTALTYAATMLPDLAAGPLLTPLADRYPRHRVLIVCAIAQAVLAAVLAIPGLPVPLIVAAVAGIASASAPFKAAQAVTARLALPGDLRDLGQSRLGMVREGGQLIGLAAAAAIVVSLGPHLSLLFNALSFAVTAALMLRFVRRRPAVTAPLTHTAPTGTHHEGRREDDCDVVRHDHDGEGDAELQSRSGWRLVWADPRMRLLNAAVLVGTMAVVPDAVIIPWVREMGAPTATVAVLLGADVVGYLIGGVLLERAPARHRRRLIFPLLIWSLAPLMTMISRPTWPVAAAALLISGAAAVYLPVARAHLLDLAPDHMAARVVGWSRTMSRAGQGLCAVLGGMLADTLGSASLAITVAGAAGTGLAVLISVTGHATVRVSTTVPAS